MSWLTLTVALVACLASVSESTTPSMIYYLNIVNVKDWPSAKLLVGSWIDGALYCDFVFNPLEITNALESMSEDSALLPVSELELVDIAKECGLYGAPILGLGLTWPGTKWCGPGNSATSYDDLGTEKEMDMCCRAHDHCDDMKPGEIKNGLNNTSMFTRLHCDCDVTFYSCLQNVKSQMANSLGSFFFNIVQNQCYEFKHPIIRCLIAPKPGNCNEFLLDESKDKIWQFFQARRYEPLR